MLEKLYQCTASTEQALPDSPGVYFFFVSGLHRSRIPEIPDFSCGSSVTQYVNYMAYRIEHLATLHKKMEWEGLIQEKKPQGMSSRMELRGMWTVDVSCVKRDLLRIKNSREMSIYIDGMNKAIMFSGPIYVGMTERQSISKRYGQHLRDSRSLDGPQKKFGSKLPSLGISWGDLAIGFIELSWEEASLSRKIERGFHSIVNPLLSVG